MRITIDMNNQGHAPQIKCRTKQGTEAGICGHWVHLYYKSETTGDYWKDWENRRVSNCDLNLEYVSGWRVEKWEITDIFCSKRQISPAIPNELVLDPYIAGIAQWYSAGLVI